MSEENKNVQETKDDKKEGNVLAGFVLYTDANMDWLRFKKFLKDDWEHRSAGRCKRQRYGIQGWRYGGRLLTYA